MVLYIVIAIFSLIVLMVLHELGHFLAAKKFGVKVEEFGIGIPPRIAGKKIGETVYSLNLLPIGAFVKIYGEDEKIKNERSYSEKTIFQRAVILLGGVFAFWVVAFVILTIVMMLGIPTSISDDVYNPDAQVMVVQVVSESPAQEAGILPGDVIRTLRLNGLEVSVNKTKDVGNFIRSHYAEQMEILIARGSEEFSAKVGPLKENGLIGVGLERTAIAKHSFYEAPIQGAIATGRLTYLITTTLGDVAIKAITRKPLPEEIKFAGPVAIVGEVFVGALERGTVDYLTMVAILSISLAIFNLLPIPALDGGRLLLLIIEKIKGSPLNPGFEKSIVAISFFVLIGLLIFITIYDIQRLL